MMMDKKIVKQQVLVANDLIDYAEDGIVSKEFEYSNAGSITLFAFDAGQSIASHSAPVDAVVQAVDGEVEITISGEKFLLKEGDVILMPKGEPHGLEAKTKFKMALFKV